MSSPYPPGGGKPVLPCPRCGKAIRPDEARCSNCGLQVAPFPAGPVSGPLRGAPQGQPPAWNAGAGPLGPQVSRPGAIPLRPPTQPSQGRRPPTQPLQGQGPASYPGPGISGGNISGIFPAPSVTPSRPFPGSIYAPGSSAPPSFAPPGVDRVPELFGSQSSRSNQQSFEPRYPPPEPPRRRGKSRGIIAIGLILLVLLLAGIGVVGFELANAQNSGNAANTSVVPTPKGQPLFHDTFADNKNGWDTQSASGRFSATVGNGSLTLEDDEHTLLWELLPGGKAYGDFQLSVDATLTKGDPDNAYGIYLRGASNQQSQLATYYRFSLYGDGSFAVFKGSVDASGAFKSSRLVDYLKSDVIKKQGDVNHITILARGSSLTFIVNGQLLKVATDGSYKSGSIALFVANLANTQPGAQATFSQLAVYPSQN